MPDADLTTADAYLAAVARRLAGPRSARTAILDELRDGLHEASAAWQVRGLDAQAANRAALTEFGPPAALAGGFAGELATARARRIAVAYLATGPAVGATWLVALHALDGMPPALTAGVRDALPALPAVVVAVLGGLAVLLGTGRRARPPAHRTLAGALIVIGAAATGDLLMLATAAALGGDGGRGPLALAAAASTARLACGVAAATLWWRCREALRAAATPDPAGARPGTG